MPDSVAALKGDNNGGCSMHGLVMVLLVAGLLAGCGKQEPKSEARPPTEVTVMNVVASDTPVSYEYVGQTQSSHQVQIRARVAGFLDKRVYTEGSAVKAGDVMFQQDPKPFEAQLAAAKGALAEQQARLQTANDNLAQVKPLAALNALSVKDLDDATGEQQAAAAAVETAKANVETARLNLSYTTITTPLAGLSVVRARAGWRLRQRREQPAHLRFAARPDLGQLRGFRERLAEPAVGRGEGAAAGAAWRELRGRADPGRRQRVSAEGQDHVRQP